MKIFSDLFNKGHKEENIELKKDIKALTQFSEWQALNNEQSFNFSSNKLNSSTAFNDDVLIQLWKEIPEISTVISKISSRAKNVPWGHFKVKDAKKFSQMKSALSDYSNGKCSFRKVVKFKEQALEPIMNTEIDRLLKNPSKLQTWGEMIEQSIDYWHVLGNSYTIKLGSFGFFPDEIKILPAQHMEVIVREDFLKNPLEIGVEESPILRYELDIEGKQLQIDSDLVLHMKTANIDFKNGAWKKGFAPLAQAIMASKTLKHEYISRLSLVRDRGMMGALVGDGKNDNAPTGDETKALYKRLQKFGLGEGKQNPFAATNGAFKWINMSFNSGELELLKGREENLKVLARRMNVPTDLLIGNSTFNNINTNGKIIYTATVIPWLNDLSNGLNDLLGLTEKNEVIMPVYDNIAELQQDLKIQTDIMIIQYNNGLATKEEAREGIGRPREADTDNFKGSPEV